MRAPMLTCEEWAGKVTATLPREWGKRLRRRHARKIADGDNASRRAANIELREVVGRLKSTRLPLGADDSDIRERAAMLASECRTAVIQFISAVMYVGVEPLELAQIKQRNGEDWTRALRVELRAIAAGDNVTPQWEKNKDQEFTYGAAARMMCESWWRRNLRAQFARAVEGAAISLGYVNRARECYVSNESVERRAGQNKRNRETMERVTLENQNGEQFTLAELAAKGVGNRAIRRGELMTRINGLEQIARENGHDGLFLTVTCPSRMHKWSTAGKGEVYENKRYDGTTPRDAQAYLGQVWKRIRAALHRRGLGVYGFRIAEPNHDGTPHWHMLLFCGQVPGQAKRAALPRVAAIVRRYALADSPEEPGARKHRVIAVRIDWGRGTAAGYIAKYVAKNIDGMYIERDLLGNNAIHAAARVEAWAATWGIRQFQPIGGAPVTVWRELRRVKELPEDAPEHLRRAWVACNKIEGEANETGGGSEGAPGADQREGKKADFAEYVRAQGGPFIGRDYAIRLEKVGRTGEGIYGDPLGPVPVGVAAIARVLEAVGALGCVMERVRRIVAESARYVWRVVRGSIAGAAQAAHATWTRVNNCTRSDRGENENVGENSDSSAFFRKPGMHWAGVGCGV